MFLLFGFFSFSFSKVISFNLLHPLFILLAVFSFYFYVFFKKSESDIGERIVIQICESRLQNETWLLLLVWGQSTRLIFLVTTQTSIFTLIFFHYFFFHHFMRYKSWNLIPKFYIFILIFTEWPLYVSQLLSRSIYSEFKLK